MMKSDRRGPVVEKSFQWSCLRRFNRLCAPIISRCKIENSSGQMSTVGLSIVRDNSHYERTGNFLLGVLFVFYGTIFAWITLVVRLSRMSSIINWFNWEWPEWGLTQFSKFCSHCWTKIPRWKAWFHLQHLQLRWASLAFRHLQWLFLFYGSWYALILSRVFLLDLKMYQNSIDAMWKSNLS